MFQFRAFPPYTYLIQCTVLEYCSSVLPHSEISGSTLICSSPKLIAACHVLHRLLMPRHSPCALFSLTCVEENAVFFALVLYQELCRLLNYAGSTEVRLTKLYLPFVRENCASLRPPCWRTSVLLRFLFLPVSNPFHRALKRLEAENLFPPINHVSTMLFL